ncbi:MAG: DUF4143 domain-containing protein [Treponema sp.]|nr:DUF4143 domain-containing protein [Treponema sp.]
MEEFGKNEYINVVSVNFEKQPELASYFDGDISPARLIKNLELLSGASIRAAETLIIFDEVQESGRALNSLKYFCDEAPQYHIIAAGSFLGVASRGGFPVGKVHRITLYPLSFYEFLAGIGKDRYIDTIKERDFDLIRSASKEYENFLKAYFLVGGMPKAVAAYAARENVREVRSIQNDILSDYKDDFSKHISPINTPKVQIIWNSIPCHLSKEKKKFMYKELKEGARAYSYEDAMNWLFDTHIVYKITRTEETKLPLASYADENTFKLYMLDIGLFGAKSALDVTSLLEPTDALLGIFNGAMTEQFILQELISAGFTPYYWGRSKGAAEVDFVIQWRNEIVPVEVKAGIRKKSKSLDVYREMYRPAHAVCTTLRNFGIADDLYSVPLYMIASLEELLSAGR